MKSSGILSDASILRQKAEELHKKKPAKTAAHLSESEMMKFMHELEVHQIELELQNEELLSARTAAQAAAEKYTELFDFAPSGYFALSKEVEIIGINLSGANMLGKERSQLQKSRFALFVSNDTLPIFNLFLGKIFESRERQTCEIIISTRDNLPKDIYLIGIAANKGDQCLIAGIDITERKKAEAELREKEVQYRNLADSGLALIWTSGSNKLRDYFNKPWLEFRGRTFDEEAGNGWTEGIHRDDIDRCLKTYNTAFDYQEAFDMEFRLRHSSGVYRWIYEVGTPNYNSKGEFIGFIGHCFDFTRYKLNAEELKNKEILAARSAAHHATEKLTKLSDLHDRVILHLVKNRKI
jgi:PAS domain S-box-containing protein